MSCPCWEQPRAASRHAKRRSMNTRHFESFMHLQVVLAPLYATHVAACALAMGMMTSCKPLYRHLRRKYINTFHFYFTLTITPVYCTLIRQCTISSKLRVRNRVNLNVTIWLSVEKVLKNYCSESCVGTTVLLCTLLSIITVAYYVSSLANYYIICFSWNFVISGVFINLVKLDLYDVFRSCFVCSFHFREIVIPNSYISFCCKYWFW